MKTTLLSFLLIAILVITKAQAPPSYYNTASGKSGAELKTALYNIIKGHTQVSYTPGVWNAFYTTDKKANGKVWDMYSDVPGGTPPYEYTLGSSQGSASNVEVKLAPTVVLRKKVVVIIVNTVSLKVGLETCHP